uniref:Sorting nexin 24 n=1 Tax=Anas platyrhynchos platyrhynchos TaxID=8840 RepID=U3HZF6_ANAPP
MMRHLVAMLFSFVYGYFTCTLICDINVCTLKGHYYPSFLSEFLFVSAQEVHKDSRDPFKACEELGPKGPGAEAARLRVVLADNFRDLIYVIIRSCTGTTGRVVNCNIMYSELPSKKMDVNLRCSGTCLIFRKTVILENEELPKIFLDFLNVRHVPTLPKAESCGSFDETESEESSKLSHQPVLLFLRDPYVLPKANDDFPNVVIEGILHGIFYPHLLPR